MKSRGGFLNGRLYIPLFVYLLTVLCLRCCTGFFSSCGEQELLPSSCRAPASHCRGFPCCGARALGMRVLLAVAHELSSCGDGLSCSSAHGIFPDQGLNPRLLHWQADSLPLSHLGCSQVRISHKKTFPRGGIRNWNGSHAFSQISIAQELVGMCCLLFSYWGS